MASGLCWGVSGAALTYGPDRVQQFCADNHLDMLIRAPPDPNAAAMPESARSWLTDAMWGQLKMLETLPVFKSVSGALTQNMEQDSLGWRRW